MSKTVTPENFDWIKTNLLKIPQATTRDTSRISTYTIDDQEVTFNFNFNNELYTCDVDVSVNTPSSPQVYTIIFGKTSYGQLLGIIKQVSLTADIPKAIDQLELILKKYQIQPITNQHPDLLQKLNHSIQASNLNIKSAQFFEANAKYETKQFIIGYNQIKQFQINWDYGLFTHVKIETANHTPYPLLNMPIDEMIEVDRAEYQRLQIQINK